MPPLTTTIRCYDLIVAIALSREQGARAFGLRGAYNSGRCLGWTALVFYQRTGFLRRRPNRAVSQVCPVALDASY